MGTLYRFPFFSDTPDLGPPRLHMQRDGDAFGELLPTLLAMGYQHGGVILNPPRAAAVDSGDWLGPDDLVVLTTRPPLSDDVQGDRRRIARSGTELEQHLFAALHRAFATSSRSHIVLNPDVAGRLGPLRRYADTVFFVNGGPRHTRAAFKRSHPPTTTDWIEADPAVTPRTLAYFVYMAAPREWPGGPAVLCSFGLDGTVTLLWNHWLATRPDLSGILTARESVFVLAEITMGTARPGVDPVPADAVNLRFGDTWDVVIDQVALDTAGAAPG